MVKIDSGPLEATDKFEQVPKDKWFFLMLAKRDFLARRVSYDCRCLVEFCEEAELAYEDCGFRSAAEMIQHGYELDPVEIELAVAWLKHNQPKQEISLEAVTKTADKIRELRDTHPDWTQQKIAEHSGVSRQYVHKVLSTDKLQCNNSVDTPGHIKTRPHQADFRKLPLELQQQVAAKEVSLNAAAIAAGIRKKPTPEDTCLKAFSKVKDRVAVAKEILTMLTQEEVDSLLH